MSDIKNVEVEAEIVIEELDKIPVAEWAKIWCEFNCWNFPASLNHVKPQWWDTVFGHSTVMGDRKFKLLMPVMHHIVDRIGAKACNREWNIDKMTDEEHEMFWGNRI